MRPEIKRIVRMVGLADQEATIIRVGAQVEEGSPLPFELLLPIDQAIPGVGIHNVDEVSSGVYRIEDRPIFRPIQYVYSHLNTRDIEWFTRDIIKYSCLHVENSLKLRLDVDGPYSIGMILKRSESKKLNVGLSGVLQQLNSLVYNRAKHTIERNNIESHMFSVSDAVAIYLSCRMLGAYLLRDISITTKNGVSVFGNAIQCG